MSKIALYKFLNALTSITSSHEKEESFIIGNARSKGIGEPVILNYGSLRQRRLSSCELGVGESNRYRHWRNFEKISRAAYIKTRKLSSVDRDRIV